MSIDQSLPLTAVQLYESMQKEKDCKYAQTLRKRIYDCVKRSFVCSYMTESEREELKNQVFTKLKEELTEETLSSITHLPIIFEQATKPIPLILAIGKPDVALLLIRFANSDLANRALSLWCQIFLRKNEVAKALEIRDVSIHPKARTFSQAHFNAPTTPKRMQVIIEDTQMQIASQIIKPLHRRDQTQILLQWSPTERLALVQAAIEKGADPNFKCDEIPIWFKADPDLICDFLSKKLIDTTLRDMKGNSGAHHAAGKGHLQLLKQLLELNKTLLDAKNGKGRTPLCFAVIAQDNATIEYLVDQGASLIAKDDDQYSPLDYMTEAQNFGLSKEIKAKCEKVAEKQRTAELQKQIKKPRKSIIRRIFECCCCCLGTQVESVDNSFVGIEVETKLAASQA